MTKATDIQPFENELPSHYADRLGLLYSSCVTTEYKKTQGQFFTPIEIAQFMGSLANSHSKKIKILDPGCGTAILSCALVEKLVNKNSTLKEIELKVYETDENLIPFIEASLDYVKKWLQSRGVAFIGRIDTNNFVLENKDCFQEPGGLFFQSKKDTYDVIISNPPYFKIPKEDKRVFAAHSIDYGQPNIYSVFVMVASKLLTPNGELIFIIPRSFSSGNYFRAFRKNFFNEISLERIHLFGSRRDTFNRDGVLQETLIIKGKKEKITNQNRIVFLSHSNGGKEIDRALCKEYQLDELIDLNSTEKILHLPINEVEDNIIKLFKSWEGSLEQYDIQISTGPVVSFRSAEFLFEKDKQVDNELVPLYQLHNISKMNFEWPFFKKSKPQYIQLSEQTRSLLIPNKNYIFLRRFSAKDDKSRLVAAPYFAGIIQTEFIGVENHLNYIYRPKGHLDRNEILGLSALLNSNLFDTYFRTFNGNINVSATELREMPLPPLEDIKQIGNQIILLNDLSPKVDDIVNQYFDLENIFVVHE